MCAISFLLSVSTSLLGFIYKNSIEHQMAFTNRIGQILATNKLERFDIYSASAFNILCLMMILVPLGLFSKSFRFTHFLAGLALLVLNVMMNFEASDPTNKYFLMVCCMSIGLLANGSR